MCVGGNFFPWELTATAVLGLAGADITRTQGLHHSKKENAAVGLWQCWQQFGWKGGRVEVMCRAADRRPLASQGCDPKVLCRGPLHVLPLLNMGFDLKLFLILPSR